MANNTTNSNFVNIQDLPQSQIALDTDLLILQTANGTGTITFDNFNVVKEDINGNTVLAGSLTGNDAIFTTVSVDALSSQAYFSNGIRGSSRALGYANRMTLTNGLVTSADFVIGSPEYTSLYNLIASTSAIGNRYEAAGPVTILQNASTAQVSIPNVPSVVGNVLPTSPWCFTLIPAGTNFNGIDFPPLSSVPRVDGISFSSLGSTGTLNFVVNVKDVLPVRNYVYYRILYFY
jgi:hypothetical protein